MPCSQERACDHGRISTAGDTCNWFDRIFLFIVPTKTNELEKQTDADGDPQDVAFTPVVVTKEPKDSIDVDSMVRKYAKNFELEVSVEVFDLRSLMSELDR